MRGELHDGALNGRATTVLPGSKDDVYERRRFVPSPPCLPLGGEPPAGAVLYRTLTDDQQRAALSAVATAIDTIHRFRVAHGSLSVDRILLEGKAVWIEGVDAQWNEPGERSTPRERDLSWFRGECERMLGPPLQAGIGRTCRGMIAAWREPPPALPVASRNGRHPSPPKAVVRRRRVRVRVPWGWVFSVAVIIGVVGGVAAWQLTPLPVYTMRTLRWGFRKFPDSVRSKLDPNGKFDPLGRRFQRRGDMDGWAQFEMNVGMQRADALRELLTKEGDEYAALLRKFLKANDEGFNGSLRLVYTVPGPWTARSIPRLKQMLGEKLPSGSNRTLEYCFLRIARPEDLPDVESILVGTAHLDSEADAYDALARLGRRAPLDKILEAAKKGSQGGARYLHTLLFYYPAPDAQRFLDTYATSNRQSRAEAWQDILEVVESAPSGFRAQASSVFEATLRESIPISLAVEGPTADADLLMTLLCLWRLRTVSPEEIVQQLSAPTPQGAQIRARLAAMLIGDASSRPGILPLPDGWEIPDEWYAAVLADGDRYPALFVQETIFRRLQINPLQQQSRLLALANVRAEAAREALAADLAGILDRYHESWRASRSLMISSVCALLAAAETPKADEALAAYLAPGPYAREPAAWEGLIIGAGANPARHRTLLRLAAAHPLPTIWTRARERLALADGDVQAFRNADRTRPAWPPALTSLVEQLEPAVSEADVFVVLSRQRAGQMAEMALGLSASAGATAVLHARMDRSESPLMTYLLLANQPVPLDPKRFDEFLRSEAPFQPYDPSIMLGQVIRDDRSAIKTIRSLAVGPRAGKGSPPLLHRLTAMYAFGALQAGEAEQGNGRDADPEVVRQILAVIDRDASFLVRHEAAAAALRCVRAGDKKLLTDFAAQRPKLPASVSSILRLAEKL
jgi:hypothetical protein